MVPVPASAGEPRVKSAASVNSACGRVALQIGCRTPGAHAAATGAAGLCAACMSETRPHVDDSRASRARRHDGPIASAFTSGRRAVSTIVNFVEAKLLERHNALGRDLPVTSATERLLPSHATRPHEAGEHLARGQVARIPTDRR